jgi:hypothetical protein
MTFNLLIVIVALVGILFFISAIRNFRRRRALGGMLRAITALALFLIAVGAFGIAANLGSYRRMNAEMSAGELQFTRLGYHQFNGVFTSPTGARADFALRGDEWQIDARILKWRPFASLVGFDTAYRLDRIGGRYTRIEDERSLPRTVYPLNPPEHIDLWQLLQRYQAWVPWIDALYGSATYLPMADGARYEIKVSPSGLLARPLNPSARAAVGGWHEP